NIGPGDRIGILGENGAGKSSLLHLLNGSLRPTLGHIKTGRTVHFATLTQNLDELTPLEEDTIRVVLSRYKTFYQVEGKKLTPAALLERAGFTPAEMNARIKDLSGGQRRRLQLLLILLDEPNVLILDEPGNDLDTDMLAMLEDVLDTWAGTLIMVTHDRHLMERVTDDQYALIGGKVVHCPRGVDEYLQMLEERDSSRGVSFADVIGSGSASLGAACAGSDEAASSGARPFPGAFASSDASVSSSASGVRAFSDMPAPSGASAPSGARASLDACASSGMAASSGAPASPRLSNAEMRELKKRLSSLQRRINTASSKVDAKRAEMSAADPTDFVLLGKLQAELDARAADKEALEDEWLEVADALGEV
ncbi:MAG: ATP-binding cassette domain-containing protein, partial [Slackia sp.]|nr:ATP-binding cassette domain-containing protein [Slackia sp.]